MMRFIVIILFIGYPYIIIQKFLTVIKLMLLTTYSRRPFDLYGKISNLGLTALTSLSHCGEILARHQPIIARDFTNIVNTARPRFDILP